MRRIGMTRHTTSRRPAIVLATFLGLAAVVSAAVGVTDGPKGVVVNPRNGKAYAAFPDLGIVKIVNGVAGPVVTLKTGATVKNLSLDPRGGRVYAMNRGPGTISVIDPDTDAIVDTLKADRGSLTALNPVTNKLYVAASTGTDPSVIDLATNGHRTGRAPRFVRRGQRGGRGHRRTQGRGRQQAQQQGVCGVSRSWRRQDR